MIHEDLLLSRIDILENKLLCYQKNVTDEKLQKEVIKLQDDKTNYQVTTFLYFRILIAMFLNGNHIKLLIKYFCYLILIM